MKSAVPYYVVCLISLLTLNGCKSFPLVENCITSGTPGILLCEDKRLPKDQREYTRPVNNDYCTNPDDLQTMLEWVRKHDK